MVNGQQVTGQQDGDEVHGVRPAIEQIPLDAAQRALERLRDGSPRFRIVLDAMPGAP